MRTRIERRYRIRTEPMTLGPLTVPFTRVADPDQVLDDVAAAVDRADQQAGQRQLPQHLPYWAELWDSAVAMATFLASSPLPSTDAALRLKLGGALAGLTQTALLARSRRSVPPRPAVLDLGCGMGLSGVVAAALGAAVLFADLEPPALLFARLNAARYPHRARQVDWQTDRLPERFDLILGADILYERSQWEYLEPFWRAHLHPGGTVLLGEPGRPTGDSFQSWIVSRGWSLTTYEQPLPTRPQPVRLFRLTMSG